MEWISVKDKFPEKNATILATDGKNIHIAVVLGFNNDDIGHADCDYGCPVKDDTTHWMELPKLPKDK